MRKQLSYIMFADLQGYSLLTDPQHDRLMVQVLPLASLRIQHLPVAYINTWGDGIVASDPEVKKICEVALELRDFFANTDWPAVELPPLAIRISIHIGQHTNAIDPFTKRPSIIGPAVIRAARLEPITKPGEIWITKEAAVHVDSLHNAQFACDSIGSRPLAKKHGTEEIFVLRRINEPVTIQSIESIQEKFTVGIAITIDKKSNSVLVVKRAPGENISWMFPSVKISKYEDERFSIFQEVFEETNVRVIVHKKFSDRIHPLTKMPCVYYFCTPSNLKDGVANLDPTENTQVAWVPFGVAQDLIGDSLSEDVRALFDEISAL